MQFGGAGPSLEHSDRGTATSIGPARYGRLILSKPETATRIIARCAKRPLLLVLFTVTGIVLGEESPRTQPIVLKMSTVHSVGRLGHSQSQRRSTPPSVLPVRSEREKLSVGVPAKTKGSGSKRGLAHAINGYRPRTIGAKIYLPAANSVVRPRVTVSASSRVRSPLEEPISTSGARALKNTEASPNDIHSLGYRPKLHLDNPKTDLQTIPRGQNANGPKILSWTPSSHDSARQLKLVGSSIPRFQHPMRGQGFVSSKFGRHQRPQGHHGLYGGRFHPGIDIAAPLGTPVHAAAAGRVDQCGWSPGRGRHICIRHGNGFETRYYHLSAYCV